MTVTICTPSPSPAIDWNKAATAYGGVKHSAHRVLCALAQRARWAGRDIGACWPSVPRIASDTGLCDRTVRRGVAALVALGVIEIEKAGGGRWANRYRLKHPDNWPGNAPEKSDDKAQNPADKTGDEPEKLSGPTCQNVRGNSLIEDFKNPPNPQTQNSEKPLEPEPKPQGPASKPVAKAEPKAKPSAKGQPDKDLEQDQAAQVIASYRAAARKFGWPDVKGRFDKRIQRVSEAVGGHEVVLQAIETAGRDAWWRALIAQRGLPSILKSALKLANRAAPGASGGDNRPPWETAKLGQWCYVQGDYDSMPAAKKARLVQEAQKAGVTGRMATIRYVIWAAKHRGKA